jgi:hypothetical protein
MAPTSPSLVSSLIITVRMQIPKSDNYIMRMQMQIFLITISASTFLSLINGSVGLCRVIRVFKWIMLELIIDGFASQAGLFQFDTPT